MTASRNTILALGLMWIALAAGNLAVAAPTGDGGPCGEATCGGGATCEATCMTCGNATCMPGCDGTDGFWLPCVQNDPVVCEFRDCLKDFCDTCRDCSWKADVSFFDVHRSAAGTQSVLFDPGTAQACSMPAVCSFPSPPARVFPSPPWTARAGDWK